MKSPKRCRRGLNVDQIINIPSRSPSTDEAVVGIPVRCVDIAASQMLTKKDNVVTVKVRVKIELLAIALLTDS